MVMYRAVLRRRLPSSSEWHDAGGRVSFVTSSARSFAFVRSRPQVGPSVLERVKVLVGVGTSLSYRQTYYLVHTCIVHPTKPGYFVKEGDPKPNAGKILPCIEAGRPLDGWPGSLPPISFCIPLSPGVVSGTCRALPGTVSDLALTGPRSCLVTASCPKPVVWDPFFLFLNRSRLTSNVAFGVDG